MRAWYINKITRISVYLKLLPRYDQHDIHTTTIHFLCTSEPAVRGGKCEVEGFCHKLKIMYVEYYSSLVIEKTEYVCEAFSLIFYLCMTKF